MADKMVLIGGRSPGKRNECGLIEDSEGVIEYHGDLSDFFASDAYEYRGTSNVNGRLFHCFKHLR